MSLTEKELARRVDAIIEGIHYVAVDNEYGDCDECKHHNCWDERHPYGSTTATERLCECNVPEARLCPLVEEIVSATLAKINAKENDHE